MTETPSHSEEQFASENQADYGEILRRRRNSYGLSIEDISASLRIRPVYLRAFEEGRTPDYPSDVYVKGFLRSYARYVQLNPDEIIMMYERHMQQIQMDKPDANKSTQQRGSLSKGEIWVALALVLLLAGVGFWVVTIFQKPVAEEQVIESTQENAAESTKPEQPENAPEIKDIAPITAEQITNPQQEVAKNTEDSLKTFVEETDRLLRSLPPQTIIIAAVGNTWVEIRDPQGVIVLSKILGDHETYIVPQRGTFYLTSGDAAHTIIHFGPGEWKILGDAGVVARNIPLRVTDLRRLDPVTGPVE